MSGNRLIRAGGWLAFWVSLPISLYFIPNAAALGVWCMAAAACLSGAVWYTGIGRWWIRDVDRARVRDQYRGYVLGSACQVGLLAFWAALVATPDSYLGLRWLLAGVACVFVVVGLRRLIRRSASRAAA